MRARALIRTVAISAVLALALAACGNSGDDDDDAGGSGDGTTETTAGGDVDFTENVPVDAPGVTDTEIHVAVIASKTNPMNGKYAELADGMNAYFDMVNEEGGIYGRQIKITSERDDVIGLQNQEQVQASLAEDNAFATFLATLGFAGADELDAAGMPTFIWNIRPEMAGHDNVFANSGAICFGCSGQVLPWLTEQLGSTKVGILAYGVANESKLCAQGNRDSFEEYTDLEVAFYDDTIQFAAPDLSAQVAEMKEKGVDFITTCMDINETILLAREMQKQGLDAVQQLPNGYDANLVAANADLLEGAIVIPQFVAFENEPQIPEVKKYLAQMEKIGKDPIEVATVGWILADQFVTGLKLAGPEFSQQKVIDGLNTLTDYDDNGFIPPIDWTKQHNDPAKDPSMSADLECANFTVVRDGKFVPQYGQPGKPFVCFPANAETLAEPQYMSFAPEEASGN
jgi:ABC-type branched-subunit amino acid transport system substrate-binding protein